MAEINFTVSRVESDLILKLVERAEALPGARVPRRMTAIMDLTACHANGCPLKLPELLAADDMNFAHDVFGIFRHIDRETGKLTDCFVPRFAYPTKEV